MPPPTPNGPPPHQDPCAWEGLLESLGLPAILVVISSWMGGKLRRDLTAEDILQEALAMAWRDREKHAWQGLRPYRAWLLQIARNRIHDAADRLSAKKRGGDREVNRFSELLDSGDGSISSLLPARSTTPSQVVGSREQARLMEEALASLPEPLGAAVRLRLFEELPMREVAERLGVGLTTAKERFFQGARLYYRRVEERLGRGGRVGEGAP